MIPWCIELCHTLGRSSDNGRRSYTARTRYLGCSRRACRHRCSSRSSYSGRRSYTARTSHVGCTRQACGHKCSRHSSCILRSSQTGCRSYAGCGTHTGHRRYAVREGDISSGSTMGG
jgi:hypothetical protein